MKRSFNLNTFTVCFFCFFLLINNNILSQGNNNGNANPNNNANGNAIKWETQGNNADTSDFIGTTNPIALKVRTNNTERMRITQDGKIGVGVHNPTRDFEVNKTALFSKQVFLTGLDSIQGLNEYKFIFLDEGGQIKKGGLKSLKSLIYKPTKCLTDVNGNSPIPTWENGLNKIYSYCPKVNVGIGTSTPIHKLDVRGHVAVRNLRIGNIPTLTDDNILIKGYGATSGQALMSLGNYQGAEEKRFEVKADGSVEIYHIDDSHQFTGHPFTVFQDNEEILQLKSSGLLRARKIRIDLEDWSDFVFEEDYPLMPLTDLKVFIAKNKHLPQIPSEEELVEEGLDLAEMNKLLMQKVEELTLYLLEQNEKTEELQKEVEELKFKLSQMK